MNAFLSICLILRGFLLVGGGCFIIGYPDSALPFFRPFPHFIHTISGYISVCSVAW